MVSLRRRLVFFLVVLITLIFVTLYYQYQIRNAISYASRPLWDTPDGPKNVVPHFYAPGIEPSPAICKLHGFGPRPDADEGKEVWDAVLLSTELDLLEIRMNELDSVVDRFFVIESDRTFTGIPKPAHFKNALSTPRFARFAKKTTYALHPGRVPKPGESPFAVEGEQRAAMTRLISSALPASGRSAPLSDRPTPPPLVIMSDVDEIPAAHTIKLVKACAFPRVLHLQLRNYVYSYEWPSGWGSWRAQVHEWTPSSTYIHSMATDMVLADAGWHCSFCFRTIEEFISKMKGYSHADRIGGDMKLLDPARIQKTICSGQDIFNMLPEAYTVRIVVFSRPDETFTPNDQYKEMFQLMNPEPTKSGVGLPWYVIEHADRLGYLLPGGCERGE